MTETAAKLDKTITPAPSTPISSNDLLQPTIAYAEIDLKEEIGHGSYGVVYKAEWRNQFVAVKKFEANADQKAIETEVKQLSRVRHPNIIALYGISVEQKSKFLIMEYAEGGSLHTFLHGKIKPYYSTAHAMNWAYQCAEGVEYLHAMKPKPLIHRDLKPLNLLLTKKGRLLKICDFGTVADKSTMMTNNKGSAAWMAPEVFEGSKYTEKCDIFSWAIVLWEVLSRQQPFKEIDNTWSIMWKIHKGERPPLIEECPAPIQNLITSCWDQVPDKRPSMKHVVQKMKELIAAFTGADDPLEYEFSDQTIIHANDEKYTMDFSSFTSSNPQYAINNELTPTSNMYSNNQPGGSHLSSFSSGGTDIYMPATIATTRWDVIPEEQDEFLTSNDRFPFKADRYETIRRGMENSAFLQVNPISVDYDPNAWDLDRTEDNYANNDGKDRHNATNAPPFSDNVNNNNPADETDGDDDEDEEKKSLASMLESDLRPENPINNPESQAIYHEHNRLIKEYFRVLTKTFYAQDFKDKLLSDMDPNDRKDKEELLRKMKDKEELQELYNNLQQELEKLTAEKANSYAQRPTNSNGEDASDGWVVVSSNPQNT